MRPEHLTYLVDPKTKQPLKLKVVKQSGPHVMAGELYNQHNSYPLIDGIPRLLENEQQTTPPSFIEHQKKTAASFAYEWNTIYQENPFERQNFLHFLSPFIKEPDLKDKLLLDIGCGSGRFTKQAALSGAKVVIATDVGDCVSAAFSLTKELSNVCLVQADVYHMPVQHFADLAFSIGVLHHLPQPQDGFSRLPATVKPGGQLLIWVYNRRHNWRAVYVFESIRKISRYIPKPLLFKLCYLPAGTVHGLNFLTHALNRLGAKNLAKAIPFSYYANFPFSMKLNDAFDVLATPKSNYYYVEEINTWFQEAKLQNIKTYEHPEAGITAVGRCP